MTDPPGAHLRWYWARLRGMPPGEIVYRGRRLLHDQMERLRLAGPYAPPPPDFPRTERPPLWKAPTAVDGTCYDQAARAIAAGRLSILSLKDAQVGDPPRWNRDPLTGTEGPLVFGKTLDYRDSNRIGDIKHLWEPNRHLHLVTLAQAYALTQDAMHLETLRRHLKSWLDQCPYALGPNWSSALELAIRLINWAFVWDLIGGREAPLFAGESGVVLRASWLRSIYQHVDFIRSHLSRYSSANNHLIGELTGMFVASKTWPYWIRLERCGDVACRELCREALTQSAADGVNREQSTCYHRYVAEFMVIAGLVARATGGDFPSEYWERLEAMIDFIASVMDAGGNVPMIGDTDDGLVVRLDPRPAFCPFRSLLAAGAVVFSRPDFRSKAGALDDNTLWLLGEEARASFERLRPRSAGTPRRSFEEGGYFILGSDLDREAEVRVVADAGPLGYTSLAAHGHADALSFTLSVAGRPFLIDPGTYAYHTKRRWRDYFRGTSAHNTARIDGENQSVIAGSFLWGPKASGRCEVWQSGEKLDRLIGSHNGYLRLDDPVLHGREIRLRKSPQDPVTLVIVDTFECRGAHRVELFFHFDNACEVWPSSEQIVIARRDDSWIEIAGPQDRGKLVLYRGNEELPMGWVSRSLNCKTATTSAVWRVEIRGTTSVETKIRCFRNRTEHPDHGSNRSVLSSETTTSVASQWE